MHDLSINPFVFDRMGYDDLVAATALDEDGQIELALLAPGSVLSDKEWVVVIHYDCDPEDASRGSSAVEPCGIDRDVAEQYYLSRIAEHFESLRIDEAVRVLNAARP
jgi:hypothetical protein